MLYVRKSGVGEDQRILQEENLKLGVYNNCKAQVVRIREKWGKAKCRCEGGDAQVSHPTGWHVFKVEQDGSRSLIG